MKTFELKLTRIGNSKGVRLPVELIRRYGFAECLAAEVREDGLLLKSKQQPKLSWTETGHEMARSREEWGEWDGAVADGLESCPWEPAATSKKKPSRGAASRGDRRVAKQKPSPGKR